MKGYSVYSKIQQLKERGFRKDAVAKSLGLNWRTVDRYWNMTVDEYESNVATVCKARLLDDYRDTIICWLRDYPTLSAAQVCDWLKEHYSATFSERTVSRYVKDLRKEYNLRKAPNPRDYEAVPELPMGQQLQVDFGEKWLKNVNGGRTKVYAAAFVLAHSRFKYAELQSFKIFVVIDWSFEISSANKSSKIINRSLRRFNRRRLPLCPRRSAAVFPSSNKRLPHIR